MMNEVLGQVEWAQLVLAAFGLLVASVSFVYTYSKSSCIKHQFASNTHFSNKERGLEQIQKLRQDGGIARSLTLQGYDGPQDHYGPGLRRDVETPTGVVALTFRHPVLDPDETTPFRFHWLIRRFGSVSGMAQHTICGYGQPLWRCLLLFRGERFLFIPRSVALLVGHDPDLQQMQLVGWTWIEF